MNERLPDYYSFPPIDEAVRQRQGELTDQVEAWLAWQQGSDVLYAPHEVDSWQLAELSLKTAELFAIRYAEENEQVRDQELERAVYRGSMLVNEVCRAIHWLPRDEREVMQGLHSLLEQVMIPEDRRHDNYSRYLATRPGIDVFIERYAMQMQDQLRTVDHRDYSTDISMAMALQFQAIEYACTVEEFSEQIR